MRIGYALRTRRERAKREVIAAIMAKPFGKLPKDWLKTTETKDYLQALAVRRKSLTVDLVEVRQGGTSEEKGCTVVVDTLSEKAGKNEFPAFF